jgi:hypothetical protein
MLPEASSDDKTTAGQAAHYGGGHENKDTEDHIDKSEFMAPQASEADAWAARRQGAGHANANSLEEQLAGIEVSWCQGHANWCVRWGGLFRSM